MLLTMSKSAGRCWSPSPCGSREDHIVVEILVQQRNLGQIVPVVVGGTAGQNHNAVAVLQGDQVPLPWSRLSRLEGRGSPNRAAGGAPSARRPGQNRYPHPAGRPDTPRRGFLGNPVIFAAEHRIGIAPEEWPRRRRYRGSGRGVGDGNVRRAQVQILAYVDIFGIGQAELDVRKVSHGLETEVVEDGEIGGNRGDAQLSLAPRPASTTLS